VLSCNSYLPKSVSNNNYSEYCSRHVDELATQARTTQTADPAAARTRWAQVDRTITNEAPCIPIVNLTNTVLTSRRLGNVQANPVLGPLFDQMWIQ
jgi:ABC-type transport system substrate-binding protein